MRKKLHHWLFFAAGLSRVVDGSKTLCIRSWSTEKFKNRIKVIFLRLLGRPSHVLLVAGRIILHSGRNVESRNITLAIYPFGGTSRDLMSLLDVPLLGISLGISLVPTKEVPRSNPSLAYQ